MNKERVLFTGASGFIGKNILDSLSKLYEIESLGLSDRDIYYVDISNEIPDFKKGYDLIIHAAGKAHHISKNNDQLFFDINFNGTKNLCAGLERNIIPKVFIFLSTVAVYGLDCGQDINEDYPLNGKTPYALSKIAAESYLQEWCAKHNVILGIIRPSLIAGKNPPGNLGEMINGIKSGRYFRIGDGRTRKSVLMAEDLVRIIPRLAEKGGCYNMCDDHHPSFAELESLIAKQLGKKGPVSIPYWSAKFLAVIGDIMGDRFPVNSIKLNKLVQSLTFSNKKAKQDLDWEPLDVLSNFRIS